MIASLLFYIFSFALVAGAVATVTIRQPVAAVLCMIFCFFNAAVLFLFLGAEFLAFILLIVYVGAVAVLFLFVVMMLDIKQEGPPLSLRKVLSIGGGLAVVLVVQMALLVGLWPASSPSQPALEQTDNTRQLGAVLYTDYAYLFQVAGFILLTAMIGAIILSLRDRKRGKKQDCINQITRRREDVIEICSVKTGEGVL